MYVNVCVHIMAHMWRSEDYSLFHHVWTSLLCTSGRLQASGNSLVSIAHLPGVVLELQTCITMSWGYRHVLLWSGNTDMNYHVLEKFWEYRHVLLCPGLQTWITMSWDYRHVLPCPGDVLGLQTCSGIVTCFGTSTMSGLYAGSGNLNWGSHICITGIFFTEPSSNHESLANP